MIGMKRTLFILCLVAGHTVPAYPQSCWLAGTVLRCSGVTPGESESSNTIIIAKDPFQIQGPINPAWRTEDGEPRQVEPNGLKYSEYYGDAETDSDEERMLMLANALGGAELVTFELYVSPVSEIYFGAIITPNSRLHARFITTAMYEYNQGLPDELPVGAFQTPVGRALYASFGAELGVEIAGAGGAGQSFTIARSFALCQDTNTSKSLDLTLVSVVNQGEQWGFRATAQHGETAVNEAGCVLGGAGQSVYDTEMHTYNVFRRVASIQDVVTYNGQLGIPYDDAIEIEDDESIDIRSDEDDTIVFAQTNHSPPYEWRLVSGEWDNSHLITASDYDYAIIFQLIVVNEKNSMSMTRVRNLPAGKRPRSSSSDAGSFALHRVFPNPVNASTTVSYTLPQASDVRVTVNDVLGRQIKELVSGTQTAGTHQVVLDASRLPSGVYVYSLSAGNYSETKRMVVVR